MKSTITGLLLMISIMLPFKSIGQNSGDGSIIQGIVKSGNETLIGVNVSELDVNILLREQPAMSISLKEHEHFVIRTGSVSSLERVMRAGYEGPVAMLYDDDPKKEEVIMFKVR